jgi:hypothetical protein
VCSVPVYLQDFSIVAADEHQVFIAGSNRGGSVSLYLSDTTGQFYVKSLDHIVAFTKADSFMADLYEVTRPCCYCMACYANNLSLNFWYCCNIISVLSAQVFLPGCFIKAKCDK